MTVTTPTLAERLTAVRAEIAAACVRAGRPADAVTLIAVSKTHPAATLLDAIACGQTHFGENRIEEATDKIDAVNATLAAASSAHPPLTWHMIGHVQSRKARDVIARFDCIHSLDSVKLAERYSRFAMELERPVTVLLEINISGEASKSGFSAAHWQTDRSALWEAIGHIIALPGLRIGGLMTIAPVVAEPEQARPIFAGLRQLRDALAADFSPDSPGIGWESLSMGMSDDFGVAIEEGATLVRIGRAIFGPRESV
jgi:pyridoxal phosphate enzyme (YggS family)